MTEKELKTAKDLIFYSYADLGMAHYAVQNKLLKYDKNSYIIRAKLLKGLLNGTMNIRSIFDDEKIKLKTGHICNYCGSNKNLALEHIFPKKYGGKDDADNLILVCRYCNSSKGKKDLIEWMYSKNIFLPLMVIRRYLKLIHIYLIENSLIDKEKEYLEKIELPFKIKSLPIKYPDLTTLKITIND